MSIIYRALLSVLIVLVLVLYPFFQGKNILRVTSIQLANILNVDPSILEGSTDKSPSEKLKAPASSIDSKNSNTEMIGLPGIDMNEMKMKARKNGKLIFSEWYKTPRECLGSKGNANPDIKSCVNRRMRARRQYFEYLDEPTGADAPLPNMK